MAQPKVASGIRIKRLKKELKHVEAEQAEKGINLGFTLWCLDSKSLDDELMHWEGVMLGPDETPYAGGNYPFKINIPEKYPMKPPEIYFTIPIYHPNISQPYETKNGLVSNICIDILKDNWSPALNLINLVLSIRNLLTDPNFKDPLNSDAVDHYEHDKADYERKVRSDVRKYAM
jgi:ubiquitin-conjugating enzyme E2 D/E